jgi:hypothetical protein
MRMTAPRWDDLSCRRADAERVKLGVAYCRGSAFSGRLLVKTFILQ